jgi:hypothetical protein
MSCESGSFWDQRNIYPSLTTTGSEWPERLEEIKDFGLKEIGLFLTGLSVEDQLKLVNDLARNGIRSPLVHLRNDTGEGIIYKLLESGTQVFVLHSPREFPYETGSFIPFRNRICLENAHVLPNRKEIQKLAGLGLCVDFNHFEGNRRKNPFKYYMTWRLFSLFPCGSNHISPVEIVKDKRRTHEYKAFKEFDYLLRMPEHLFSPHMALEVSPVNTIGSQLEVIRYIKGLFSPNSLKGLTTV